MFTHLIRATQCSLKGLTTIWREESAFRMECILLVVTAIISLYIDVTKIERLFLIISIGFILIAEVINTAIENIIDRFGKEKHILSGKAKDIGSALVFLTFLLAIFIWIYILCVK